MKKVVVVGAGLVGSTAAYTLMIDGVSDEIAIVDVCKEKAEGHSMDMSHGRDFVPKVSISSCDDYSVCRDADIIIICAGTARKPGQSRLDLIHTNADILKDIISRIKEVNTDCILVIVSNPVDVLTYLAIKEGGFPANKVIGTGTMLDTARFKFLLSEHFKVEPTRIDALVLGEHGATAFPYLSHAKIDGKPLADDVSEIFDKAKNVAAEVIERKGATYYAIALCISKLVRTILTNKEDTLPVSTLVDDVCLSVPCIINKDGIKEQIKLELNKEENKHFDISKKALKEVIDNITS